MSRVEQPLSRRAFFKLTASGSAAVALSPGLASAQSQGPIDEPSANEWKVVTGRLKDHDPGKNPGDYLKVVKDLWRHFRLGTQGVPFDVTKADLLKHMFDYYDSSNGSSAQGSGKYFSDNLARLSGQTKLAVETRYCCYLAGHGALLSARKQTPVSISLSDYESGWKAARVHLIGLHERLNSGQPFFGGGC